MATSGRASAAGIVVNSTADTVAVDNLCTLREAIQNANNNAPTNVDCAAGTGADTITFTGAGVGQIILGSTLPDITDAAGLTINGGSMVAISGNFSVRVFMVGGSLTLENLAINHGRTTTASGGGIFNNGTLTVANSTMSLNRAQFGGGGIFNLGTLTVTNSTLSLNATLGGGGGGIFNLGTLTVTNSTLSGNASSGDGAGGGIANFGTLTVTNSTLSANGATGGGGGGGIFNDVTALTLTVTNSTLSENLATGAGGGGIRNAGTLTVTNSIVANSQLGGDCSNAATLTALGNNRDTDGTCPGFSQVTAAQLNLGPLLNNGGPTNTHALLSGSVAINAGNQSLCTAGGITTDQRGVARDAICDIGSFEFVNNPPVASFTHACQGLRCRFDGSGSSDPDGAIARYAWDFGDGATGSGAVVRRIYAAAGTYMVTLKVIDPERASDTETKAVTVTATP